jgi:hypothetical protein
LVGLYKLNAVEPWLESAWFQTLNLKCDILVSKFAFKCNLYHFTSAPRRAVRRRRGGAVQLESTLPIA